MKYLIGEIKASFIFSTILIVCTQICFLSSCYGQIFVLNSNKKRDAISFVKAKNLIVIPVFINEKGPYNFLLDTGVDPLVITDSVLSKSFNQKNLRPVKINGAGSGEEINAFLTNNVKAAIGESTINNIPTIIIKDNVFNLSNFLGIKVHGIIGYYFFKSFTVKINYQSNRIVFKQPKKNKRIKGIKLKLLFLENKPYINTKLSTDSLGEINALLIVDSGASHALSLETYQGGVFPIPKERISGNLGIGLSGAISGKISRINSITLGNYQLKNLITNFPNYSDIAAKTNIKNRTGNIGAEILSRFHITFDYQNAAMYIKKNASFKDRFEHDMSGIALFIKTGDYNRFFIHRIEIGSPAEKAGFEIDDELVSINFKDISLASLDDVTNMLKSSDGNTLLIELVRNNNVLIKLLKLKKRV